MPDCRSSVRSSEERESYGDEELARKTLDEALLRSLMLRYQAGELDAAEELVNQVSPILYSFLRAPLATRYQAEDLLQQCWLEVHGSRHTFRSDAPVLPWLFAIAKHVRRDAWRRGCITDKLVLRGFHAAAAECDERLQLREAMHLLKGLPQTQQQAVILVKVHGFTLKELAAVGSCSIGAAKQRLYRASEALRRTLSPSGLVTRE